MNSIRLAKEKDLTRLTEIYNQAIVARFATAHTQTMKVEDRRKWFDVHQNPLYPIFVIEEESVKGYCTLSPYRESRQAFIHTAEISYYIDFQHHRQGLASQLIQHAEQYGFQQGIKTFVAFLFGQNVKSIHLLEKQGYCEWGKLPQSAVVDKQSCDHVIYGKSL